ncbi:hypothetical protein SAMN04488587_1760 [Methanococcoides vulcani]|uniref:Uncharacterized protein n=1 Tax=Methanococcoides vulcani TaxID=1353158 RepID=A0A1I0AR31_9EURY|nr:hypothetical protein [Methanococcoides vulcani]SES96636.1 hypothetical protein SAMN04488587_1760 [Methanococcoides vulcani]
MEDTTLLYVQPNAEDSSAIAFSISISADGRIDSSKLLKIDMNKQDDS